MKLKKLIEARNKKAQELRAITEKAASETRALTPEEIEQFNGIEDEIRNLDDTIDKIKSEPQDLQPQNEGEGSEGAEGEGEGEGEGSEGGEHRNLNSTERRDIDQFASYIRNAVGSETRDDVNLTQGDNGAVIPTTIADMIIKQVKDRSPIYEMSTRFTVVGNLTIPYYDEESHTIEVAWAEEFKELESTAGEFKSIELTGYLAGALSKISKSLVNNSNFDLVSFVVNDIAEKVALFIEAQIINASKMKGLSGVKLTVRTKADTAITSDELIDLQDSIKDAFQEGCIWVMNPKTRTALRKLKDNEGRYILNSDITSPFGKVLLGKPCYASDAMPYMEKGKPAIYYGNFSGLAVKEVESMEIQILLEKFATQHAIGALTWIEIDSDVMNAQKISQLIMGADTEEDEDDDEKPTGGNDGNQES